MSAFASFGAAHIANNPTAALAASFFILVIMQAFPFVGPLAPLVRCAISTCRLTTQMNSLKEVKDNKI
jgi:hypothetical protein